MGWVQRQNGNDRGKSKIEDRLIEIKLSKMLGKKTWTEHQGSRKCLPDIFSKYMKISVHIKTCMLMFTAAIFIINPNQKQAICASAREWTGMPWFMPTTEYLSMERNK